MSLLPRFASFNSELVIPWMQVQLNPAAAVLDPLTVPPHARGTEIPFGVKQPNSLFSERPIVQICTALLVSYRDTFVVDDDQMPYFVVVNVALDWRKDRFSLFDHSSINERQFQAVTGASDLVMNPRDIDIVIQGRSVSGCFDFKCVAGQQYRYLWIEATIAEPDTNRFWPISSCRPRGQGAKSGIPHQDQIFAGLSD